MSEATRFARLVRLTEAFVGELRHSPHVEDACGRCVQYLAAVDELGCHDVRAVRQVLESVASDRPAPALDREPAGLSPAVRSALEFLREHYTEDIGWTHVAGVVRRSPAYLARRFRTETRATLRQHLRELRVQRAAQLIPAGDKVEFIMLSVGYRSKRTFYAHFRQFFGVTPGVYRTTIAGVGACP